ncbi:hypothetical protein POM88_043721 [Heracleum sosnowskyi]|uniref:ubiquitinyl hydrolase 1 n=1 Tax=Heracleum sosnowskyi TaxID=360622 RepID=A0AAD8H428_9APIA|nr:hypothetical protein POM88_043721 [Heracleum sosnowskyi]
MKVDAHEFLNFLLNELVDIVEKEHQAAKDPLGTSPPDKIANGVKSSQANGVKKEPLVTWVHENFQGILTNETSLQEAPKRMKIKKTPEILVIHLKRFKYMEQLGRYKKLSYRVVFPLELKLKNTVENSDSEYSLFAVVVHEEALAEYQRRMLVPVSRRQLCDKTNVVESSENSAVEHEDAHEFLNFLLNELVDIVEKEHQAAKDPLGTSPPDKIANGVKSSQANGVKKEPLVTRVHENFQGILTNETSSTETLNAEDKFFCDRCRSLQEAPKRMKIKKTPEILVIHLKRFKYMEQLGRYKKLSYRVVFPLELKLKNTVENSDSEYSLFAVVVHEEALAGYVSCSFKVEMEQNDWEQIEMEQNNFAFKVA